MLKEQQYPNNSLDLEYFVIFGLGSLGQHCIVSLTEFDVKIIAIERRLEIDWEIESLRDLLEDLIIGDCRHNDTLHQAYRLIKDLKKTLVVSHLN